MMNNQPKNIYGKLKITLDRGRTWIGIIQFVLVFVTFIKVYSIPDWMTIPLVVGGVLFTMLIGYFEVFVFKAFEKEQDIYKYVNPVNSAILEKLDKILEESKRK